MKIELVKNKVHRFSLVEDSSTNKKKSKDTREVNATLNIENEVFLNKSDKNIFRVKYTLVSHIPSHAFIELEYYFDFRSDTEVDNSISSSDSVSIDAPNLAYPYMKVYIENALSTSGYGLIPLPFVDFKDQPLPPGPGPSKD